ncbi:MAG TPA: DNA repair protein RadC [Caulobacteraceae bacterium]|jgi:DNA repair protein RadC
MLALVDGAQEPSPQRDELRDLTARALQHGLADFDELDTLALILSRFGVADPFTQASRLLERFGCMPRVLGATEPELRQVVSRIVALDLRLFAEATRRSLDYAVRRRALLGSTSAVEAYLKAQLAGRSREQFRVLFLDKGNHLIRDEIMGEGTVDHAPVYPREVMRRALELAASGCCLAHNHPTGMATPSAADIEMTRQVIAAGKALGIVVHDHFLVAGDAVVSFRAQGLM